jgi:hypothetical protein
LCLDRMIQQDRLSIAKTLEEPRCLWDMPVEPKCELGSSIPADRCYSRLHLPVRSSQCRKLMVRSSRRHN